MTSAINLGIMILLKDQFSAPSRVVRASMAGLSRDARDQALLMRDSFKYLRDQAMGMTIIGSSVVGTMAKWIKVGSEYSHAINYIGVVSDMSKNEVKGLDNQIKTLVKTTSYSSMELAAAAKFLAKAGYSYTDTTRPFREALDGITYAAQVAQEPIANIADVVTSVYNRFQQQGVTVEQVINQLTYAAHKSKADFTSLAGAIKYSGDTMANLNIPLNELMAMSMTLQDVGVHGETSGIAIANAYRKLTTALSDFATKKQTSALADLGLRKEDILDSRGELKNTMDLWVTFAQRLKHDFRTGDANTRLSIQQRMQELFSVRGGRVAPFLDNLEKMAERVNVLKTLPADFARIKAEKIMDTQAMDIKLLSDNIAQLKIQFSQNMEPIIRPLVRGLTAIVQVVGAFMQSGFGSYLTQVLAVFITWKTVTLAFTTIKWAYLAAINSTTGGIIAQTTAIWAQRNANLALARSQTYVKLSSGVWSPVTRTSSGASVAQGYTGFLPKTMPRYGYDQAVSMGMTAAVGASALGAFGKIFGVVGKFLGPIGMIASLLIPLIPMLFNNKNSMDKNTEALNQNTEESKAARQTALSSLPKGYDPYTVYQNLRQIPSHIYMEGPSADKLLLMHHLDKTTAEMREVLNRDKIQIPIVIQVIQDGVSKVVEKQIIEQASSRENVIRAYINR